MSRPIGVGSRVVIERQLPDRTFEPYMAAHLTGVNPRSSREAQDSGGELSYQVVDFTLAWRRRLADIEFELPQYRLVCEGHVFDIQSYDDFNYEHVEVGLRGVAHD